MLRTFPMIGSCLKKVKTTGKKSLDVQERTSVQGRCPKSKSWTVKARTTYPKRFKKPKVSTIIPTNGHLKNTRKTPPRKHIEPLSLFFLAKK
jgi:hypothetical protein